MMGNQGPGSYATDRLEQKPLHKARPNVFYGAVSGHHMEA
jgi:hypothetical protein